MLHASILEAKFAAVPPECSIFPSDVKSVSIVNLPPVHEFWNSCFENSSGNSHQYNCLLGFFPLFSIHSGEPGSCYQLSV